MVGTDYDIAYSDNVNVGTGKVAVTFKSNDTGTAAGTFTIKLSDFMQEFIDAVGSSGQD